MAKEVVILMGSKSDLPVAETVRETLAQFGIPCQIRVASAHKTPGKLLALLEGYEASGRVGVYVTIAGRSNALSGMADGVVAAPVIACPPLSAQFGVEEVFSSLRMPSGVCPAVVLDPGNAALLAAKILALEEPSLREKVVAYHQRMAQVIENDDQALQG
ncbi:MAG: AIR carboxylase family protein [Chloroflexi bacterium]|nr:AIR carboxylase family protein [Chloroflexota bacterium]